jgi:hypothetical protein
MATCFLNAGYFSCLPTSYFYFPARREEASPVVYPGWPQLAA